MVFLILLRPKVWFLIFIQKQNVLFVLNVEYFLMYAFGFVSSASQLQVAVVIFLIFNNIGFLDCILLLILIVIKDTIVAVWSKKHVREKQIRPQILSCCQPLLFKYVNASLGLSSNLFLCLFIARRVFLINLFLRSNHLAIRDS